MIVHNRLVKRVVTNGLMALVACISLACSSKPPQPEPPQPAKTAPAKGSQSAKVNIDEIFPPGPGRDLVLNNCISCHTFVPIVILQMTKEEWERNRQDHRGRVAGGLSDADIKILYEYLEANFNPDRPVPKLPKELLDTWTSY